jgi:hypothetical protein
MRSGSTVVGHKNKKLGKGSGGKMWFAMGNNLAEPMEHDNWKSKIPKKTVSTP